MGPKFFYFDLGNVVLHFDHHRQCRQMAEVAGVDAQQVWAAIFDTDLAVRYETGQVTTEQFYEELCEGIGTRPPFEALVAAGSAIFELNAPIVPLIGALIGARHRVGLLSNTNEMHWRYCSDGRYYILPGAFDPIVLSYRIGAMKPAHAIFEAAAEMAHVAPEDILYVDDIAGHVAAARAVGFDAVQYTSTSQLAEDLRTRGVHFNY